MKRGTFTTASTEAPTGQLGEPAMVLIAGVVGVAAMASVWPRNDPALGVAQAATGVLACLALGTARKRPLAVAVFTSTLAAFSPMALGATILAIVRAALACRLRTYVLLSLYVIALAAIHAALYELAHVGYLTNLIIVVPAVGLGLVARTQRSRGEAEQRRRIEDARTAERQRIAREMHDVLAHRISMVSVHAGALEFHPDAPPEDIARAAGVIRTSAHAALGELREVINLLRGQPEPDLADGAALQRPQPTLEDVPHLVEESRQAGMRITLALDLERLPHTIPAATGRTAYRIVQEGLTNARKHAPTSDVDVQVALNGEGILTVAVLSAAKRTPTPPSTPAPPGSGTGLIGLAERVALAGGRLEHGATADGGYAVSATLPVPE